MSTSSISSDSFASYKAFNDIMSKNDVLYRGSNFLPLKNMSSRSKGAQFEKIVAEYATGQGMKVELPKNSTDYDRLIDGRKVEIKGSFLWGEDGTQGFRWQQIRPSQDYDYIVFAAVYPKEIRLFASAKKDVIEFVTQQDDKGHFPYNQHGGRKVNSGTFFLHGYPENFPLLIDVLDFWNDLE